MQQMIERHLTGSFFKKIVLVNLFISFCLNYLKDVFKFSRNGNKKQLFLFSEGKGSYEKLSVFGRRKSLSAVTKPHEQRIKRGNF